MTLQKEKYYRHIKFPFDFDLSNIAKFDTDLTTLGYTKLSNDVMDPIITNFLLDHKIVISTVASFYTPPGGILGIHIDLNELNDLCKINFCYGGGASRMNWYRVKPGIELKSEVSDFTTRYYDKSEGIAVSHISLQRDWCDYADSAKIRKPTLVKVGQPHGVINVSKEGRWNLCLTLCDPNDNHLLHFGEVEERLTDYLV